VAGIGNIYAAEALFLSRIHPCRPAKSVDMNEASALHASVRKVLDDAIEAGGTTIRDYRNADGGEGQYARRLYVYGRAGKACLQCGTPVERIVLSNRSAFFCPACQPPST
jgi:formamidopyrimidine-DNA glycosylase